MPQNGISAQEQRLNHRLKRPINVTHLRRPLREHDHELPDRYRCHALRALSARHRLEQFSQPTLRTAIAFGYCVCAIRALDPIPWYCRRALRVRRFFVSPIHFVVEETTLLPMLLTAGKDTLVADVERDHRKLRGLCVQLQQHDVTKLLDFAEHLSSHVRFEEESFLWSLTDCWTPRL